MTVPVRFPVKDTRPLPGARAPPASSRTDGPPPAVTSNPTLDMMDDALARDLAPRHPADRTPAEPDPLQPAVTETAGELAARTAARTAARLDQLERLLRAQEAELRKREGEVDRLQDENRTLKRENREMHRFLADYGLAWVGSSSSGSTPRGSVSAASSVTPSPPATAGAPADRPPAPRNRFAKQAPGTLVPTTKGGEATTTKTAVSATAAGTCAASGAAAAPSVPAATTAGAIGASGTSAATAGAGAARTARKAGGPPDMEHVRRAVVELNAMADGGNGEIVKRRDGSHGFSTPSLTLSFWSNGLQLDDGALRVYDAPDAIAFLRDLLDGFFPYELKHAFPEGVIFNLSDYTNRSFGSPVAADHQWGSGRRLDSRGDCRVSQLVPAPYTAAEPRGHASPTPLLSPTLASPTPAAAHPPTALPLTTLPPSVLQNDDARDTRWHPAHAAAAVPEQTQVGPSDSSTRNASSLPKALAAAGEAATATTRDGGGACRLQIKGVGGDVACVLDLPSSVPLSAVHAALASRAVVPAGAKYELRTAFPATPLTDPSLTLADLGLTPSAALLVRIIT